MHWKAWESALPCCILLILCFWFILHGSSFKCLFWQMNYNLFTLCSVYDQNALNSFSCESCNSFLAKVREVSKSQGKLGIFAKKIGRKPWSGVTQFWRIRRTESLFSKRKVINLKNSRNLFQKSIYILKPHCLEFFWNSPYSWKEAGSVLRVPHQAIKIRVT